LFQRLGGGKEEVGRGKEYLNVASDRPELVKEIDVRFSTKRKGKLEKGQEKKKVILQRKALLTSNAEIELYSYGRFFVYGGSTS